MMGLAQKACKRQIKRERKMREQGIGHHHGMPSRGHNYARAVVKPSRMKKKVTKRTRVDDKKRQRAFWNCTKACDGSQ
jgi:hypothetical protein